MAAARRPLVIVATLSLVALVASALTGAASATDTQTAAAATPSIAAVAAGSVPSARVSALVAGSAPSAAADATRAASTALAANRPPCAVTARACVSLSARKAWITDRTGRIVYGPVGVRGGRAGEPTPVGTFSVTHKVRNYHSRQFDAPMPYSVFFYPGIAFHQGNLASGSAGCLRLARKSAQQFFATLAPGDQVQILP